MVTELGWKDVNDCDGEADGDAAIKKEVMPKASVVSDGEKRKEEKVIIRSKKAFMMTDFSALWWWMRRC